MLPDLWKIDGSQRMEFGIQLLNVSLERTMLALLLGSRLYTTLEEALDVGFQNGHLSHLQMTLLSPRLATPM